MKKQINILLLILITFCSCSKDELVTYNQKPSLHFSISKSNTLVDSLVFSFITTLDVRHTVYLPVEVLGKAIYEDKAFKVQVLPSSTAKEGIHYEKIAKDLVVKAGQYAAEVPVRLINEDKNLENGSVRLDLEIVQNENFDAGDIKRVKAKVIFNNLVTKPPNWSTFAFGPYSKVKYKVYVSFFGAYPSDDDYNTNFIYYTRVIGYQLRNYFITNGPVYDEDGLVIQPW